MNLNHIYLNLILKLEDITMSKFGKANKAFSFNSADIATNKPNNARPMESNDNSSFWSGWMLRGLLTPRPKVEVTYKTNSTKPEKKEKKKQSKVMKVLKWTGIGFIVIVGVGVVSTLIFGDA